MIEGKPITIHAHSFLGRLLLPLLPKDDPPLASLPWESHRGRRLGDCFGFVFMAGMMLVIGLLISGGLGGFMGGPWLFYVMTAAVFMGVATFWNHIWLQFCEASYRQSVRVTATEVVRTRVTITGKVFERIIPIHEYSGIRWERHLRQSRNASGMQQFLNHVVLIHPDRQESIQLYVGRTMQYIPTACQQWSELLKLPYLEPNDLAIDEYELNQTVNEKYRQKPLTARSAGVSTV
ncbi:MAG: hypothetical protein JNL67_18420 [Planctomycetaceae bacterium]|nr:hypothetical protein [Planctomycetaceae bacterium]